MAFSSVTFLFLYVTLLLSLLLITESSPTISRNYGLHQKRSTRHIPGVAGYDNIILNPRFEDGLNNWSCKGCKLVLNESSAEETVLPLSGSFFASAVERTTGTWNGIEQEITGRVERLLAYQVSATVGIYSDNVTSATIQATLWVQIPQVADQYIIISNVEAKEKEWVQLEGRFLLNDSPSRAIIFLEGPPPGTDILVKTFTVKHAEKIPRLSKPAVESAVFGVNIVENSNLDDGNNGWFPLGGCALSTGTGSPIELPPMARNSFTLDEPLSGNYLCATNRTDTWMGPAQMIHDKLHLYMTYQVSAWVRIGPGAVDPQTVNVALNMDSQWVDGGQVECKDQRWFEIGGSFRIEKQPLSIMVYVQGPAAGIDLMVAGLQIFPVDPKARLKYLRKQTDKVRKRDIILKFSTPESGNSVKVTQIQNSFPLGSCISRTSIDNEGFTDFLLKNFNWVVFENELKWSWTEPRQGKFNYKDADEMLEFCKKNNLKVRGHCIFWEVEHAIQSWVKSLNQTALKTAVQDRITGLVDRYKGEFRHYDVDNEMLHGSFYPNHIGKDIQANMFKTVHQLDPSATLFVNDFHIEDGSDLRSSPERYIEQILDLQEQGASVGGIGIQGHVDFPVGAIVSSALDKLGSLGVPIWFTELDVSSTNEYIRANDLEVMLREGFAHPAVQGMILWGFWELYMSRENAHLVDAEAKINEAGRRFLALKKEWLSRAEGYVDWKGEFKFRGFFGTYNVQVSSSSVKLNKTFVVNEGHSPLVIPI